MGIKDIFASFSSTPTATAQSQTTTTAQAAPNDPSKTNPLVPGANTGVSDGSTKGIPAVGEGDQSPLAGFEKMWETADTDRKPISLVPDLNVDPAKLMEQAKKMDFSKLIKAEDVTKALGGDAATFVNIINTVAQAGFAQSTNTTTRIVDAALRDQAKKFNEEVLPAKLKEHNINTGLRADNPLFENPAVAPVLSMVEQQLQIKFPTASASEIKQKAKEYISGLGSAIVIGDGKLVTEKPEPSKTARVETDFSTWDV